MVNMYLTICVCMHRLYVWYMSDSLIFLMHCTIVQSIIVYCPVFCMISYMHDILSVQTPHDIGHSVGTAAWGHLMISGGRLDLRISQLIEAPGQEASLINIYTKVVTFVHELVSCSWFDSSVVIKIEQSEVYMQQYTQTIKLTVQHVKFISNTKDK